MSVFLPKAISKELKIIVELSRSIIVRFLIPILLISVNSFGQQSDRDSILNAIDTIYFGEQFISYDIGIKFVKGTSIIKQINTAYLDSVSDYLGKYGECTCDLYLGHYNKVRNRLNKKKDHYGPKCYSFKN